MLEFKNNYYNQDTLYNSLQRPSHLASRRTGRGRPCLVFEPQGLVSTAAPVVAVRTLAARSFFGGHSFMENGLRNGVSLRLELKDSNSEVSKFSV